MPQSVRQHLHTPKTCEPLQSEHRSHLTVGDQQSRLPMAMLSVGSKNTSHEDTVPLSIRVDAMDMIDITALRHHIVQLRDSVWGGLDICPRTCPSALSRCCTYARWFARPSNVHARSLLDIPVSAACMRGLLRFRMGCHHLPRDEGSWARPQVPRLERFCRLCATNALGDEKHLVFECPELECFRQQWSHLYQGPTTMQA